MGTHELSASLWRERELLELLVFKLTEEQLLLTSGKSRWLQYATQEVEQVMQKLRTAGLARSLASFAVARTINAGISVLQSLDLSLSFGAGIKVSPTQILSPLRDLFAAVFFVFFGLSTDPAAMPPVILPALALAFLTMLTKVLTGVLAARSRGIALPGQVRAGLALMPRGEFSIVIAGLAVASGVEPELAPLATAYVLITVVSGPMLARLPDYAWFKTFVRRKMTVRPPIDPVPAAD